MCEETLFSQVVGIMRGVLSYDLIRTPTVHICIPYTLTNCGTSVMFYLLCVSLYVDVLNVAR